MRLLEELPLKLPSVSTNVATILCDPTVSTFVVMLTLPPLASATGLHRDPADEAFLLPLITKAHDALGAQLFAAAEAGGRALSYDAANVEARTWLEIRP